MRPAASSIGSWVTNASQRVAGGDASGSETGAFERAIPSHHVALAGGGVYQGGLRGARTRRARTTGGAPGPRPACATETRVRSEEHTSELQSLRHLVCRLLLEK